MTKILNTLHLKRGYTLLFAVLVASLALGVAVFILSVSRKQYILSAAARESMYSMYASDSGIECGALDPLRNDWGNGAGSPSRSFSCAGLTQSITFLRRYPADFDKSDSNFDKYYTDIYGDKHYAYVDSQGNTPYPQYEADFRLGFKEYSRTSPTSGKESTCALMSIIGYTTDLNGPDEKKHTIIQSRGYNVCKWLTYGVETTYGPVLSSPRTVERARQLINE